MWNNLQVVQKVDESGVNRKGKRLKYRPSTATFSIYERKFSLQSSKNYIGSGNELDNKQNEKIKIAINLERTNWKEKKIKPQTSPVLKLE